MKKIYLFVFFLLLPVIVFANSNYIYQLKNATYYFPEEGLKVKLHNGQGYSLYPGETDMEFAFRVYFEKAEFGYINNDGRKDALVLLTANAGGSGIFYYLYAAINKGGKLVPVAGYCFGDRVDVNDFYVYNHKIVLIYFDRSPDQAMVEQPNIKKILKFKLINNKLVKIN